MNQIDWDEQQLRSQGFRIVRKWREKKKIRTGNGGEYVVGGGSGVGSSSEQVIKIKGVEIGLDEDLIVKVMNKDYLYKY